MSNRPHRRPSRKQKQVISQEETTAILEGLRRELKALVAVYEEALDGGNQPLAAYNLAMLADSIPGHWPALIGTVQHYHPDVDEDELYERWHEAMHRHGHRCDVSSGLG